MVGGQLLDEGQLTFIKDNALGTREWKTSSLFQYQNMRIGPSGSGASFSKGGDLQDRFLDFLLHGARRWLLVPNDEIVRQTYIVPQAVVSHPFTFFETYLKELMTTDWRGFVEANQRAGDLIIVPPQWNYVFLSLTDAISYSEVILGKSDKARLTWQVNKDVWSEEDRIYNLCYCYDAEDMHSLPNVSSAVQTMLKKAIQKVQDFTPGIMSLLSVCGSTLALEKSVPELDLHKLTVCTPRIWKQCRQQLEKKAAEQGIEVSLDWLPKQAPASFADIEIHRRKVAAREEEL